MAVYKRGDVWWYEFVFQGERVRESTHQGNKRIAEQIEAAKRTQLAKGEVGIEEPEEPAAIPVFSVYAPQVMTQLKADGKNAGTVAFYEQKLKMLLEFHPLADCPLDEINKKLINEFKVFARRTKTRRAVVDGKRVKREYQIGPATVNRALATLRMILYHALDEEIIEAVPKIGKKKKGLMLDGERQRDFVLDAAAEPFYLAACPEPLQDAGLVMLDAGLRIGEALALTWPDIHLSPTSASKFGFVHVRKGKSKNAKRDVPLTPRLRERLALRKMHSTTDWIFPNEANDGPFLVTSLDHQQEKVREALKLPADFVVHSLRHTFGTRLGLSGADVFTIMRLMGHSSVTVSQRYVHPSSESKERAIERMMAEYRHIGADATVDERAKNGTPDAKSPHNSHHSGDSGISLDSPKPLQ